VETRITDNEFLELIDQHKMQIRKVCLFYANSAADREDLFQDVILQAWKSYSGFRHESKFSTWLYRIALNTALFARRKPRVLISPLSPDTENVRFEKPVDELSEQLHAAIQLLNEIEKSLVLLYLEGYNYVEMERITGISNGALRIKMSRIKQKLKALLK
jgi:RNA polymerase sigma-70 factor (ECF subfamily)